MKLVTSQKSLKIIELMRKDIDGVSFLCHIIVFYRSTPIFSVCTFQVLLSIYIDLQFEFWHLL